MTLLGLLLVLAVCAGAWWLVNSYCAGKIVGFIRWLMNAVIIIVAVGSVLYATGLWDSIRGIRVPHV